MISFISLFFYQWSFVVLASTVFTVHHNLRYFFSLLPLFLPPSFPSSFSFFLF
ncbi:hypothetical protein ACRRTK_007819 [Alexandromys fortis]